MTKTRTTVVTPNKRPDRLAAVIDLQTADDADAALAEYAWCDSRIRSLDEETRQLHVAIDEKQEPKYTLNLDGQSTTLRDRRDLLGKSLESWMQEHLKENLAGPDDRTLDLQHGSVSYRKLPLAVVLQEGQTNESVLGAIEALTVKGKSPSIFAQARELFTLLLFKALKATLSDMVKVSFSLNFRGMIEAHKAGRLDTLTLQKLGLDLQADAEKFSFKVAG